MPDLIHRLLSSRRSDLWVFLIMEGIFLFAWFMNKHHGFLDGFTLTLAPIILAMGLSSNFGSPKNWWAAYFGITMKVNLDRFAGSAGDGGQLRRDIESWLAETKIKPVYQVNAFKYVFLRNKHAAMFKLAWG